MGPLTTKTAQERLDKLSSTIKVLEYVPAKKGKSLFVDVSRTKTFSYYFFPLLKALKANKDFLPCPDNMDAVWENRNKKSVQTCKRRYGVSNPSQIETVKEKKIQTCLKNRGTEYPLQSKTVIDLRTRNFQTKYGVENPSQLEAVKKKKKRAFEKYEGSHPLSDPKIRAKGRVTGITNGTIRAFQGKTVSEWADKADLHYQTVSQRVRKFGDVAFESPPANKTVIEQVISKTLKDETYIQGRQLNSDVSYRPDFVLPDHKLIIECDGLYWHSDAIKRDNNYHQKKHKAYMDAGYRALFFREDEIRDKLVVVESIINNALGKNTKRVFARATCITEIGSEFFVSNHLMGKGAGKCYGLSHNGTIVAGIQVKWTNKVLREVEVSRFCSSLGTTVVGGFSKLIKHVEREMQPTKITTFTDLRYGSGKYLEYLGFSLSNTSISFKWTDCVHTFHRMTFRGNTGYNAGMYKIWDCGQSKWLKVLT